MYILRINLLFFNYLQVFAILFSGRRSSRLRQQVMHYGLCFDMDDECFEAVLDECSGESGQANMIMKKNSKSRLRRIKSKKRSEQYDEEEEQSCAYDGNGENTEEPIDLSLKKKVCSEKFVIDGITFEEFSEPPKCIWK